MAAYRFPTVFISHGTPMLAFASDDETPCAFHGMLKKLSQSLEKPRAVLAISAHSVSAQEIFVTSILQNTIQYDFSGFPKELYSIQYPCPGSPEIALDVQLRLRSAGFNVALDQASPLDHGVWVPLLHLYPEHNIPIIRLSLPIGLTPALILKMGHAVASLREEGILLMASGGAVHNLSEIRWSGKHASGQDWAKNFETWITTMLKNKDVDALVNADEQPVFHRAHPTIEHYLPLLFTVGASLPGDELQLYHQGIEYDTLSMLSFGLNTPTKPVATSQRLH